MAGGSIRFGRKWASVCLLAGLSVGVQAATVQVIGTAVNSDGDPLSGFGTTISQPGGGNTLELDVSNFTVEALSNGDVENALDTLTFNIAAPAGYGITKVAYSEGLVGSVSGNAIGIATGSMVVSNDTIGDISGNFGTFLVTGPNQTSTIGQFVEDIFVSTLKISITNQVTAVSLGGTATVSKGFDAFGDPKAPQLQVTLAAVPLPPAIWLLGSAALGLVAIGRTRRRTA